MKIEESKTEITKMKKEGTRGFVARTSQGEAAQVVMKMKRVKQRKGVRVFYF